jgi:signal transduction histidine kinase
VSTRVVSTAARATVAAAGLGVVVASLTVVGGGSSHTTYGGESTWFGSLEVAVAVALLISALLLLGDPSTALLGTLVMVASAVWLAPLWVGSESAPSLVRSIGLVVAPLLAALVVAVVAAIPPVPTGLVRKLIVMAIALVVLAVAALSVALVVVRDPLRDLYCWSDCTVPPLLGHNSTELTHTFMSALLRLNTGVGVAAAIAASARLIRAPQASRRASGPVLAAAAAAGLGLAAYAATLVAEPREFPHRPLYQWLFAGRGLALLALAAGLAWIAIRPRLVRGHVTRLAVDLERSGAEGGLGRLLAGALGDPTLRLLYPIPGRERVVDSEGRPVDIGNGRGRVTPLLGDEGVLALVESSATDVEALERELGPAAQLALGNERLRAEALAHLAEVTESRARIVETADAARRRMERDLHDGAQQRMLALTYDLRVALALAEASGERAAATLAAALERATAAAQELREIASGIFPAALAASGLEAAVESLADVRPLRLSVTLAPGRRYPPDVEAAAYALVSEASETGEIGVDLVERDGELHVTVLGDADWSERLLRLEDRVGAAGGSVRAGERRLEASLPVAATQGDRGGQPSVTSRLS